MNKIKIPEISSIPESDLKKTPQSVLNFIAEVMKVVQQMAARIEELEEEVKDLKMQLAKNSSNSSKPPSSDGFNKPKKTSSLRGKSGKKVGAQIGHKSSSLEPVENPDKIVEHDLGSCSFCGSNDLDTIYVDLRQVIDIPKPQQEVTEHRILTKKCRSCKKQTKALFPENIKAAVQYGDKTKALVVYLNAQQLVPVKRITEMMADCYDLPVSSGFVAKTLKDFCSQLKKNQFEELVTEALLTEKILHVDETGMRCQSGLKWLHTTSSVRFVLYKMHKKRGRDAIDDINILPRFTGFIVHDCLSSYFGYPNCKNVLCNAHIS